jgi:hypothetical protein
MSDIKEQQENPKPAKTERSSCNRCGGPRIHELKFTHRGSDADPNSGDYYEAWTDELWVCCGCEMATLVHHWELVGAPTEAEVQPEVHLYPPRTIGKRQSKYFIKLPPALAKLYRETVEAFNAGSMLLCTIGLRALIEGVCKNKGIEASNLEKKIDGLSTFFRNETLVDSLHGFRFAGNDAAHDLEAMYPSEASDAMEVMEDLMNFLYDFDYKASKIKNASKNARIRQERSNSKG